MKFFESFSGGSESGHCLLPLGSGPRQGVNQPIRRRESCHSLGHSHLDAHGGASEREMGPIARSPSAATCAMPMGGTVQNPPRCACAVRPGGKAGWGASVDFFRSVLIGLEMDGRLHLYEPPAKAGGRGGPADSAPLRVPPASRSLMAEGGGSRGSPSAEHCK